MLSPVFGSMPGSFRIDQIPGAALSFPEGYRGTAR